MRKPLKLKQYFFERINITLPTFPGIKGSFSVLGANGKAETYMHKNNKNVIALRWTINLKPKGTKNRANFGIFVSIVGVFELPNGTVKEKCKEVENNAPAILYEIIKDHLGKSITNSLAKSVSFPPINFKKLKLQLKP